MNGSSSLRYSFWPGASCAPNSYSAYYIRTGWPVIRPVGRHGRALVSVLAISDKARNRLGREDVTETTMITTPLFTDTTVIVTLASFEKAGLSSQHIIGGGVCSTRTRLRHSMQPSRFPQSLAECYHWTWVWHRSSKQFQP